MPVFEFAWPWVALLLPLPWLLTRVARPSGARGTELDGPVLLNPAVKHVEAAFAAGTPGTGLGGTGLWLAIALWTMLVATLMRPQWLEPHAEVVSRGYDLMLAVDVSRSMEALDFTVEGMRVNRLAVVKGVVGRFIEQRRGDRIGLVLFGDGAYLQSPLTLDGAAVRMLLDGAVPRMAGDGTAIGDAIGLAVKKLRERPEGSRVLVLLTDGKSTAGSLPPEDAARLATRYGVRIYTVGVGSEGPVPVMQEGRMVMTEMEVDRALLRRVAAMTGGAYFHATDSDALEQIYQRIDALEETEAETRTLYVPHPMYRWPLGVALLLVLILGLMAARRTLPGG